MAAGVVMCPDHPEEKLRFVCVPCDRLVCRDCKLTDHEGHKSVDVAKTSEDTRQKLQDHVARLEERMKILNVVMEEAEDDRRAAMAAQKDIADEIRRRAAMMTEWVKQLEQQALEALDSAMTLVNDKIDSTVKDLEYRSGEIKDMVETTRSTLNSMDTGATYNPVLAFTLEQDLRSGRGKGENLEMLTEGLPVFSVRPILYRPVSLSEDSVRMFIGLPQFAQVSKATPTVNVSPIFNCGGASIAAIHSICPMADGTVWIARNVGEGSSDQQVALFSQQGKLICEETFRGPVSLVQVTKVKAFVGGRYVAKILNASQSFNVVLEKDYSNDQYQNISCKSEGAIAVLSKLKLRYAIMSSQAAPSHCLCKMDVKHSPLPLAAFTFVRTMDCPRPVAMDVDSSGQFLAVVTCDQAVRVFRLSDQHPPNVYCPSGESFSPSDVCFYTIGGKEMLLVADWFNSTVNVLEYCDGIRFVSYFGSGCPLLQQPTALTQDDSGRLWVGCKDGHILTCSEAEGPEQK